MPTCLPTCPSTISARGEGKAMLAPVTEWVLAGQQTTVCKHHRENTSRHETFYRIFVVCKHFLKTDPQRLSKVKKKMPFPSWVGVREGERSIHSSLRRALIH